MPEITVNSGKKTRIKLKTKIGIISGAWVTASDPTEPFLVDRDLAELYSANADKFGEEYGYKLNKAMIGKKVGICVKTAGIKDDTPATLTIYEYDPTIFDPDEELTTISSTVSNNEINVQFDLSETYWDNESDNLNELYFNVEIKDYDLEKELPAKTDNYLSVYQDFKTITVIIELPHSVAGGFGHTAIAIEEEFYDFGPDLGVDKDNDNYITDRADDPDTPDKIKGTPVLRSRGTPYWDHNIGLDKHAIKYDDNSKNFIGYDTIDFKHAKEYIKNDKSVYGNVYFVEINVTEKQAKEVEKWWINRYSNTGKYSIIPFLGEQCTTTVRISLEDSGVVPTSYNQSPEGMLNFLKSHAQNTAGPKTGERPHVYLFSPEKKKNEKEE